MNLANSLKKEEYYVFNGEELEDVLSFTKSEAKDFQKHNPELILEKAIDYILVDKEELDDGEDL